MLLMLSPPRQDTPDDTPPLAMMMLRAFRCRHAAIFFLLALYGAAITFFYAAPYFHATPCCQMRR